MCHDIVQNSPDKTSEPDKAGGYQPILSLSYLEKRKCQISGYSFFTPSLAHQKRMENFHKTCKEKCAADSCSQDLEMVAAYFCREEAFFCSFVLFHSSQPKRSRTYSEVKRRVYTCPMLGDFLAPTFSC